MSKGSGIKWGVALLAIALMVMALGSLVTHAMTPAGTMIGNQAVAQYKVSGGDDLRTATSNVVYVKVKQVAGVSVSPTTGREIQVTPNQQVLFSFKVTNTGNGPDSFNVKIDPLTEDSQTLPGSLVLYRDVNSNGVIDAGDVEILADDTVGPIEAGHSVDLVVRFRVPSDANGGEDPDKIEIQLTATSQHDSGESGKSAVITFTVISEGVLSATMEAVSDNAENTSEVAPNGKITYTITAVNQGMTAVTDGKVVISLPDGTSYIPGTLKVNNNQVVDDPDSVDFPFEVSLPTVNSGHAVEITYQVQVDGDRGPGFITNEATVKFRDRQTTTNQVQTRVLQIANIELTQIGDHEINETEIGKTYSFTYKVKNIGNGIDRIYVKADDDHGWPIALYAVDGINELPKMGGQYTVGNLNPGGETTFVVKVTVPTSVGSNVDGENEIVVTATSAHDPEVSDSGTSILKNFKGAGVALHIEDEDASKSGNPGTVVTYEVDVENLGPATDLFELTASDVPQGYALGFFDTDGNPISNISVQGYGTRPIRVRVTIPSDKGPIDPDDQPFNITARSQNRSTEFSTKTLKIGVNEVLAVEIAPNRSGSAYRNGFTEYTVTVRNLGNNRVDVALQIENANRLEYMFTRSNQTSHTIENLAPNATEEITIRVYVPSETAVGTVETVRVTATVSKGGQSASDFATLTTTVIGGELTLQKHVVGKAPDEVHEAAPGEHVAYAITAKNISVTPLTHVVIYEKIPAYTTFVSATVPDDVNVTAYYSTDGGTNNWTEYDPDNPPEDLQSITDIKWELDENEVLAVNDVIEVTLTVVIDGKEEE